jgi:hypothetical protein
VVLVANWRVKETERMVAICTELQKVSESYVQLLSLVNSDFVSSPWAWERKYIVCKA